MVTSGKGWLLQHLDFSTSCALAAEQSSQQLGDRLPRMLYEVIWYPRARCLSKTPAETCDWERLGRLHNKFPPYYHSCPSCADAKKISLALTQLITAVHLCTEWIKKGGEAAWFSRKQSSWRLCLPRRRLSRIWYCALSHGDQEPEGRACCCPFPLWGPPVEG